jgi:hypothetical protein
VFTSLIRRGTRLGNAFDELTDAKNGSSVLLKATEVPLGSFAFGQVRRLDGRTSLEWVFQRDDFRSDVTTGDLSFLKRLIGGESSHHVRMSGHEDPQADAWDLRSSVYEGDGFHSGGGSPSSCRSTLISHLPIGVRIGQPGEREASATLSKNSPAFSFLSIATNFG